MNAHYKIGLTLSGGGSKGIAHIGVLRALLENGIKPEIVSGTSAGAIIGALYAAGNTPDEIEQAINDSNLIKIFRVIGMPGAGLVKLDYLKQRLSEHIAEDSFESLVMPLFICATNLNIGKPVIFSSGTLFDKVVASCAVPWLFKPVLIDGQLYADGGITNNMPAGAIRDKCDILIGCNVKPKLVIEENKNLDTLMGISQRCVDLSLWTNSKPNVKMLDVYIAPEKVTGFSFFSIRRTKELCDVGYEETLKNIPKIKQLIENKNAIPTGVSHTPQQLRG
jgi:NTE family protein